MNCTGGIFYHDLCMKFLSPTINLFFKAGDFIKFCENIDHYLSIDDIKRVTDCTILNNVKYPIAILDDITIHFMHYKTFEEAKKKWNERKKRILHNKLVILACDRDGMDETLISRFQKLPYKKVLFCNKQYKNNKDCIYLKGYENLPSVGIITDPYGWTGKQPVDQFDWIEFLNGV